MSTLDDENIIITAVSSSLDRSVVESFPEEGARITLTAHNEQRIKEMAANLLHKQLH